jgi:hypothetical protein
MDLSFRPPKEIIKADSFKVNVGNTEYVFDNYESAKYFKWGYKDGYDNAEIKSKVTEYKKGYEQGRLVRERFKNEIN